MKWEEEKDPAVLRALLASVTNDGVPMTLEEVARVRSRIELLETPAPVEVKPAKRK